MARGSESFRGPEKGELLSETLSDCPCRPSPPEPTSESTHEKMWPVGTLHLGQRAAPLTSAPAAVVGDCGSTGRMENVSGFCGRCYWWLKRTNYRTISIRLVPLM